MNSETDTPKLTESERHEAYKQAFELLEKMNRLLDDAFSKHITAYIKQLRQQEEKSNNQFLHVKQVIPNIDVNSTEHKMFEAAEEIEDQLSTARHIVTMATDCGYNAALADESHPGDGRLDGGAIHNTLQLALDSIKKAERQLEEYRYMHLNLSISEKTLVKTINELDQVQRKRLINSIKQSLEDNRG